MTTTTIPPNATISPASHSAPRRSHYLATRPPFFTDGPYHKKKDLLVINIWSCIVCGAKNCLLDDPKYEVIFTEEEEEEEEYDPLEPLNVKEAKASYLEKEKTEEILTIVEKVVEHVNKTNGLFLQHKYLGKHKLENKMRDWLTKHRFDIKHYAVNRMAIKLVLKKLRSLAMARVEEIIIGESKKSHVNMDSCCAAHYRIFYQPAFESMESKPNHYIPIYPHQLMSIAAHTAPWSIEEAAFDDDKTSKMIAWVILYVAPLITEDPTRTYACLRERRDFAELFSHSDLAFAFLALSHGITHWRRVGQYKLEHGRAPDKHIKKHIGGFLYDKGIACKEAKVRYDSLQVYFYSKFHSPATNNIKKNRGLIQEHLNQMVKQNREWVDSQFNHYYDEKNIFPCKNELCDYIIHRVFYWIHS